MDHTNTNPETGRVEAIAALNDALRINSSNPMGMDRTVMAHGLVAHIKGLSSNVLPDWFLAREVRDFVAKFDAFSEDNDPYGERDYGSFEWRGEQCFWKIDYYDSDLSGGSSDPANPSVTARVLTIGTTRDY